MKYRFNSDFFWIAMCQFVALIANIVLIKILTNELTLESYGYYSLLMTLIVFARQIIYDPISYVVVKECGQLSGNVVKVNERMRAIEFIVARLFFYSGVVTIIAALCYFLKFGDRLWSILLIACVVYLVSNGAYGLFLAILNIIQKRKAYALLLIFDSLIKILSVILFFVIAGGELLESMVSIAFGALVSYAAVRWYIRFFADSESYCSDSTTVMAKSIFINSVPLYLPTAMMALKGVGDRWILAANIGVEDLAIFNVLLQLGFSPVLMIIGVIQTFAAPVIYNFCKQKGNADIDNAVKYIFRLILLITLFALLGCSFAVAFGPKILIHIVSKDYYEYLRLLPIFIAAGAIAACTGVIHLGVLGLYETKTTGKLMTAAMILGVFISTISVIGWGFNGALFGLLSSNVVAFIIYSIALLHKRRVLRMYYFK